MNERFDPHTARRVMGDITLGASLGGVAGGMLAWAVSGLVPVATMLAVMAAFNVVCLLALSRLGPGERRAWTPASAARPGRGHGPPVRAAGHERGAVPARPSPSSSSWARPRRRSSTSS